MFNKSCFLTVVLSVSLLFISSFCYSESFRVHNLVTAVLESQTSTTTVKAGINDSVYIVLPKDRIFMQGIDIDIKIPKEIAAWSDSIAYSIYQDISPVPESSIIDYSGEKLSIFTLPGRLSQTIKVPFKGKLKVKESPYYEVMPELDSDTYDYVFLRFQLAMKGVTTSIEEAQFDITIKPILSEEGLLHLESVFPLDDEDVPQEKTYSLFIDEKSVNADQVDFILSTGLHHLSIVSEFFRNEVRSFTIEQAKTTSLVIDLRDISPTVLISSPENVLIYLDGEEFSITSEPTQIQTGEHSVRFVVGDYEVIKNFQAVNGTSYNVSLSVDVQITEN